MKQTLQLFLLMLCGVLCLRSQAQTCPGEVLNISAPDPSTSGTKQSWQVPAGGIYKVRITARGAAGGSKLLSLAKEAGKGALMSGDFFVASGQVLEAIAGARGQSANQAGGGGGGSGVQIQSSGLVLVLAGGGGGAGADFSSGAGGGAPITNSGTNGGSASNGGGGGGGLGGNGQNGTSSLAGGGGYDGIGGSAPMNSSDVGFGGGGFGAGGSGGSSGGGGGGGYSGGNAGTSSGSGGSGGGSYNIGTNQSNFLNTNANALNGQVIIQCLGTAAFSAIVTPTLPNCGSNQGSINIDLTGDLNGFSNDVVEYAIVSGTSFSGNPTFTSIAAEPFDVTTGTGTTPGTYTVRIRLKYNPDLFTDQTYTLDASGPMLYVKANATGANNGRSWANAFTDLEAALNAARANPSCVSQIWVAAGTYQPAVNASFSMLPGVAILGGFPNTGNPTLAERNWSANPTILRGNGNRVINNFQNGLTNTAILDGFTVTGGGVPTGDSGAGIFNSGVSPQYRNCIISGNTSDGNGGGMSINGSSPTLINCVFIGNTAPQGGGLHIAFNGTTSPTITNCSFSGNKASLKGGGVYCGASPIFNNCLVWGNEGEFYDNPGISLRPTITNTVIKGQNLGAGIFNGSIDPLFVSQPTVGLGTAGDLRLQSCSPAINAGDPATTSATVGSLDLGGNSRFYNNGRIDIGAYEYQSTYDVCACISNNGIVYVNASASGGNSGRSWANAYTDLEAALNAARANPSCVSQIWVAAGTYKPTADASGNTSPADARMKSFVMVNGVAIYGGFNGTETQLTARNWRSNPTILSGNIGDTGIDTDNSYRVINNNFTSGSPLGNTAILDGVIVEKGYATGDFPFNLGGGMWNAYASPKVQNCVFRNNYAESGGAMFNDNSSSNITNCLFFNNTATTAGSALSNGGGTNQAKVVNCTFYGNTGSTITINNQSSAAITNCIVWGNGGGISGGTVTYSNVQGGVSGTGNVNSDPRFENAVGGDFRLQQCSPAIDAGTATNVPITDFEGNNRVDAVTVGGVVDMGAYEYQGTYDICSACANTTGVIVYVNASASGNNSGRSWADAFTDLQSALTLARNYPSCVTQIWVAAGTYQPAVNASFSMLPGVAILGGFPTTGNPTLTDRNWSANPTILRGNGSRVINNNENGLTNTAILDGFTVTGGTLTGSGAGIYNILVSPQYRNCIISGNTSDGNGGGMSIVGSSPTLINCVFIGNTAQKGGGLHIVYIVYNRFTSPIITNCSFSGNKALQNGGGIYCAASPIFNNCLVWGNEDEFYDNSTPLRPTITNTVIKGQNLGAGILNGSIDPLFVSQPTVGLGTAGDLRLQSCSPAINAGDPATTSATVGSLDLGGNSRFYNNGRIDIGAYEYQSTYDVCACISNNGIVYVNASASGGNNGRSWANAYTDLEAALNAARANPSCVSQIWVAAGTYKPTSGTDRGISFSMVNGVAIYGGFPNDGSGTMANRNWITNQTILSGDLNGDDTFTGTGTSLVIGNTSDNSYCVIRNGNTTDNTARLDGFIVSGANNSSFLGVGSGVYNNGIDGICNPVFVNCVFRHNLSRLGGAIANYGNNGTCNPTFTHCLFYQNQAIYNGNISDGGAMRCIGNVTTVLSHCTFSQNKALGQGGAIYAAFNSGSPNVTLRNCILWDNTAVNGGNQIFLGSSTLTLNHTLLQGGTGAIDNTNGIINNNGRLLDTNPLFVDAANGNFRLQQCSPAIDAGTSMDAPTTDLDGNNRVDAIAGGGVVDMGAYEYQTTFDFCSACANTTGGIVYVNASASGGSNNGSSWANAYTDLQSALTLARTYPSCVSQIWVAKGTYKPTSGSERGISFSMVNGVAMYGGFPNDGTGTMANRNWNTNPTILSGDIGTAEDSDNSYTVVVAGSGLNATAILDGFSVTGAAGAAYGAGIYVDNSSPIITNCLLTRNSSTNFGGGLACYNASPVVSNCTLSYNTSYSGGGMANGFGGMPIVTNCLFIHNNSTYHAGGGGLYSQTTSMTLTNCTFSGNSPESIHCNAAINISNCVIWGNSLNFYNANASISNCIVEGGYNLCNNCPNGNGNANPLFVNAAGGNFQLQVCSPAINAGDPATTLATVGSLDLGGNSRFYNNGRIDIGAYEYQGTFDAVAPIAQVTNSTCTTAGGIPSGGVISAPSGSCPAGSSLYYSTDNGGNWSTTVPTYAQSGPAQTIWTRCTCDTNPASFGPTSMVTTVPGTCPTCPDLTVAAPAVQVTNSVCTTFNGTASGGVISAPSGSCPAGSILQYSTDNGGNWSTTLPTYTQTGPAQTIVTRCNCTADVTKSSPTSTVTTVPGTCPTCPDLTAAAPAVQVTNSVCMTYGGTASGGSISAPSGSCPVGSTLQYSTDNGGNWSTTLPTYAQTGPAQTIVTRCNCTADVTKSSPTSTVTTVPGTCPACPDLTATAPAVQVTNSVCMTYGGTASGGVISVPSGSCPAGSTLQYSTDNGGNWSTTLPTYAQTGPAQTIVTRCNCTADVTKSSPTSTVTTVPGTCPACPDLTAAAPAVQVTNSVCTTFNGTASGGSISAPSGSCPAGSTLQYSTDNGGNWSTTLPIYAQTGPAQTIVTRCNCTADVTKSSPMSTVTTVPGTCPVCPDLTAAAPVVQVTNSVCTTYGGMASGGVIIAPSGSCPAGSTLQYSTDNGGNWSTTLPTYAQTGPAQTIVTRCNCTADATKSSPMSTVTTVPGTCPACPVLTAAAPAVQVTNSVCTTYGGTASGGVISAPSGSCPAGSTLQYSTDNGGNWSTTLPTYAQTGPAQTIVTRCNCTADVTKSSPMSTVTTVPGTCPACPVLTASAPVVQVTNSVCQAGCMIGGGSISAPSGSCPVGSTLQYQLNVGGWSTTLPTYAQTGPAQTIKTRCVCNSDANQMSPESSVTTIPGTVPALVVPVNGSAVVSCPALAIAPTLPVVNDCNGNPITPSAPVITNNPDPLTCEGTRTYTYSYVCGSATATWSFVYTIEREPFTISVANGSATVYDPALAVAPTPPTVMSACGEVLTPSAPVITNSPNPLLCEGTRTYTYTYTDCEGNTAVWSFVYTVLDNIAPTISCPADVVGCAGQLITFTPPVGMDNCLGAVTTQIAGLPTGSVFPVGITTSTFKVTAVNGQTAECSFTATIQGKPTITLNTLQQTLNEGNAQTLCDTDSNPVNGLQFTVSGSCVSGNPVWRVQVGSGAWSAWSSNAPVSQLSNNQPHRYQAACDASCAVTYTSPIELTINYRSTVPQNVTMLVDGVSVAVGETKEVCSLVNIPLSFTTNCGANEVTIYSVDGGEYSAGVPVGLVDNQYHNYRVRCRQLGGTVSCVESESGVMRLKLVVIPSAPTVSLSSTGSCNSGSSFSGQSSCGSLRTVWYNASTNVALPSLPATLPLETISYYARCQTENGCVSEKSNVVTFTVTPIHVAPAITASQDIVCTGTTVKVSANCPAGSQTFWNTGVTASSFEVAFSNVTKQTYWAKCLFDGGCQSAESIRKDVYWNAFVVTLINIGESKSAIKTNDRSAWTSQFITRDGGPELEQSTQVNPTLYYVENANKQAPRYWTINVEACGLSTDGSLTFDMLATPEMGIIRSFNTHENNAPYFMYANREGWTELYAQNHPAYGFYQDNGAGGNVYDAGLPKGLYKLGIRYWDQKGWGSIYPSTRKAQGNVLAYQEYWFRIQSKDGVGVGAAREGANGKEQEAKSKGQGARVGPSHGNGSDNGKQITDNGAFATVLPNPVTHTLRLKVQDSKGQVVQAALTDAAGREVLSRQFVPETNTHQEEFGVSELTMGIYFLKVTTPDKQVTLKVIKVH
ncbi:putative outer membrane repeat protein [Runella defluvii]|uniref:Putative outer membrane repeat protein n=1 Tax=Runella defluvii TaxID=370973 RepID=A0A7W6EQ72_9BACT|nr:choice-of-anchor Q domain-containing protein [Runella defluvii]MBB3838365.1 putative outer membrane repeat protein [Runella defluvii]